MTPVYTINDIQEDEETPGNYVARILKGDEECIGLCPYYSFDSLEPYTEEKNDECPYTDDRTCESCKGKGWCEYKSKDNMEEKELNICKILYGEIDDTFYSTVWGDTLITSIQDSTYIHIRPHYADYDEDEHLIIFSNGKAHKDGICILYPSRILYEKYPLDPYSAWMEWKELRKPKRWYPKQGEIVWYIGENLKALKKTVSYIPQSKWEGDLNCFQTEELCNEAIEGVRAYLEDFHKRKEGEE